MIVGKWGGWALLLLALAGSARAQMFDNFGFGPRSTAMAGAMTAEAKDYSATFYNPALIVHRQAVVMGFGDAFLILTYFYLALSVLVFFVNKPNLMGPPPDAH